MAAILMEVELPAGFQDLKLPAALDRRLQSLLDRQDQGGELTSAEREEAQDLVDLAEWLSLVKLRSARLSSSAPE